MHPSYNGYAVLGTLKIVNLILWTFWTHARSIPILLSISASLLNGYAMVKEAFKLIALLSLGQRWNSTENIFNEVRKVITCCVILHYPMTFMF